MKIFVLRTILPRRSKKNRASKTEEQNQIYTSKRERKKVKWKRLHFLIERTYCACCLKASIAKRGIECIDCGALACRKKCSRPDSYFVNQWCCIFCYQQRLWLLSNRRKLNMIHQSTSEFNLPEILITPPTAGNSEERLKYLQYRYAKEMAPGAENQNRDCINLVIQDESSKQSIKLISGCAPVKSKSTTLITVEKRIEEIETYVTNQDENESYESYSNFSQPHRVPFPELGMDIVDAAYECLNSDEAGTNYSRIIDFSESWKENWLFRKKSNRQPSKSVLMFVPNSDVEYRAMIGDKDVDETSDLSEYSAISDDEYENEVFLSIKNVFSKYAEEANPNLVIPLNDCNFAREDDDAVMEKINSGETSPNFLKSFVEKEFDSNLILINGNVRTEFSSREEDTNIIKTQASMTIPIINSENSNYILEEEQSLNVKSQMSISEISNDEIEESNSKCKMLKNKCQQIQREETLNQTNSTDKYSNINDSSEERERQSRICQLDAINQNGVTATNGCDLGVNKVDIDLFTPPKPGSIADREHKKWENAVPIKNNPYSKENIQKRLLLNQNLMKYSDLPRVTTNYNTNLDCSKNANQELIKSTGLAESKNLISLPLNSTMDLELQNKAEKNNTIFHCLVNDDSKLTSVDSKINCTKFASEKKCNQKSEDSLNNPDKFLSPTFENCIKSLGKEQKNNINTVNLHSTCQKHDRRSNVIKQKNEFPKAVHSCNSTNNQSTDKFNIGIPDSENQLSKSQSVEGLNYSKSELQKKSNNQDEYFFVKNVEKREKRENSEILDLPCKSSEDLLFTNSVNCDDDYANAKLSLPSVKKLVQVFDQRQEDKNLTLLKPVQRTETEKFNSSDVKLKRPAKHLHSLTARFLSKEFREGLR